MKTLIVFSHQYFKTSRTNKAMLEAVKGLEGVEVRNLDQIYGSDIFKIDIKKEQEFLNQAQNIIFQFPLFWYSTPPMLRAYQDEVFAYGYAYGDNAAALKDKNFYIATSSESSKDDFSENGVNKFSLETYLLPLIRTASFTKMKFKGVFTSYSAFSASDEEVAEFARKYREFILNLGK
ncbi:NAD(P)H-dependent oxidoreductase [Campylobacter geochelonis]|uniref:General stress protein 14 (GSP14) n=1 Tax=Campylobacter geochelonis TaxID=1780362 RepID=A0A128EBC7_9BACT|nr:NAD(P)H-dependent oxidoreductase [Campylobacter geochelonis]QKF70460.1 flavodoxin-like fold domain-containing protein, putative NAD(P)H (quinone) dehydrogenase/reductase [Campylobacter geochelonis]CZE46239.1 general stress protein 14 (GSP14) [Campylobacter geochelonis]